MPIYEYRCKNCGKVSEYLLAKIDGHNEIRCNYCGSTDMEKILSVVNISTGSLSNHKGKTCCGREGRCDIPPCSTGEICRRDK